MRYVVLVLLACGCNQLLGIDDNLHIVGDGGVTPDVGPDVDAAPRVACNQEIACPAPADPNKVTLCGRMVDVESDVVIGAVSPSFRPCGAGGALDGPCALQLQIYDGQSFAGGMGPQSVDSLYVDDCGRWVAEDVAQAPSGIFVIIVDDATGQQDTRVTTGTAFSAPPAGAAAPFAQGYSFDQATNSSWSLQAGLSGGTTFASQGAGLITFHRANSTPESGVAVTLNGASDPAHDYYFSDPSFQREMLDPTLTSTQTNGSAVISPISGLPSISGTGGLPSGCTWPSGIGTTIPNVLLVVTLVSLDGSGNGC
jgi:hypothetical protein